MLMRTDGFVDPRCASKVAYTYTYIVHVCRSRTGGLISILQQRCAGGASQFLVCAFHVYLYMPECVRGVLVGNMYITFSTMVDTRPSVLAYI